MNAVGIALERFFGISIFKMFTIVCLIFEVEVHSKKVIKTSFGSYS